MTETTALGAAFLAGLAVGFWSDLDELRERWAEDRRWEPQMDAPVRERQYAQWKNAVTRALRLGAVTGEPRRWPCSRFSLRL